MLPFIAPIDFKQKPTDPIVPLPTAPQAQSTLGQVLSGAYNGAIKPAAEFIESPVGFGTLGLGAVGPAVQRGLATLFAPYAAYNGARDMEEASQATNPQEAATHASSAIANLLGGLAATRVGGAGRYLPGKGEAGSVGLGTPMTPQATEAVLAQRNSEFQSAKDAFLKSLETHGEGSQESFSAHDKVMEARRALRQAEIEHRNPGWGVVDPHDLYSNLNPMQGLTGHPFTIRENGPDANLAAMTWQRGQAERTHPDLGEVYPATPKEGSTGVVFRGVSVDDYNRIMQSGAIDSDMRGAISPNEGINFTPDIRTARNYLPQGQPGVIMAVDTSGLPMHMIQADSYLRSFSPIPSDRIRATSLPINTDAEWSWPMLPKGSVSSLFQP
jgi:hypothetical protein